jgi:hypothetical protein
MFSGHGAQAIRRHPNRLQLLAALRQARRLAVCGRFHSVRRPLLTAGRDPAFAAACLKRSGRIPRKGQPGFRALRLAAGAAHRRLPAAAGFTAWDLLDAEAKLASAAGRPTAGLRQGAGRP